MGQFKEEGVYLRPFNDGDYSYQLDNFTDIAILQACTLSNTSRDPLTIFSNPMLSLSYQDDTFDPHILNLQEAAVTNESNWGYTYYWIGIRTIIRPLLVFMNYQTIRGVIAMGFFALWIMAILAVEKSAGLRYAIAFLLAVACMNLPVVASEIQFIPCFCVMFISVSVLSLLKDRERYAPLLFFVTGACTQFFDFYTYPLITLGFPLILLITLTRGETSRKRLALLGKCLLAWFAAYGLFWLIRLLLVWIFTGDNAAAIAFDRVKTWTGSQANEMYDAFTPMRALSLVFEMLFQKHNVFCFTLLGIAYAVVLIVAILRRQARVPSFLYLAVAVMPLLWTLVASRATGNHFWFQYRLLAVLVFAIMTFLADALQPRDIRCPSREQPG
ncbi:MAG: hypothetical protein ACI4O7_10915 [Aristaeellaceae bacterium]